MNDPIDSRLDTAAQGSPQPGAAASASRSAPRFTPGVMVAGRYRIVAPLGRGGMGEVYRADDTKLAHPVALKFLPESLTADPARLPRLFSEVRIGRQVSHPNVCRLYDVVEADGQHFLAMEYVDGEDLASLLRRIGRLPADKGLEIARHIAAGLAAAHDKGVIHRDLKPANVMIDGRGVARLTDFGLAALADGVDGVDARSGTPAYMAPEQLAGLEVTARSDIYALGLILYEVFTGKRRFEARTLTDLMAEHRDARNLSLSSTIRDVDPAVERVIQRCLAEDPADRPSSIHAVIASLPGGDPLQAALAAGETPSPEMVAAAGKVGDLRPGVAWACLGAVLAGLGGLAFLSGKTSLHNRVPIPKPADVLVERGREVADRLGYGSARAVDNAFGFDLDPDALDYIASHDPSPKRWDRLADLRPGPIVFDYRESPRRLIATNVEARVTADDPPLDVSGMLRVRLDARGRLLAFTAVPPERETPPRDAPDPDWSGAVADAGLDAASLRPVESTWAAPVDTDRKWAWEGLYPDQPGTTVRVEGASYHGRPVWFRVLAPWSRPRIEVVHESPAMRAAQTVLVVVIWALNFGALLLALRNRRLGRGDSRGAFRLSILVFLIFTAGALIRADHIAEALPEFRVLTGIAGRGLYVAASVWLYYMAVEPFVRRRWPHALISWTRLLSGRLRDPLVGRDVLVGALAGIGLVALDQLANLAPGWLGMTSSRPLVFYLTPLSEVRHLFFAVLNTAFGSLLNATGAMCLLLLLRIVARREWLAGLLFVAVVALLNLGQGDNLPVQAFFAVLAAIAFLALLTRVGLLAVAIAPFYGLVEAAPVTLDLSRWYAGRSAFVLLVLAAVAACGFYTSLGGKPLFGSALDE
jgi:serine/threonine-protein kinase